MPLYPHPHSQAEDVRNGRKARLHLLATPNESALLGSGGGGLWDTAQRFWRKSYAGDYLGLAILLAGFLVVKNLSEPFYQTFVVNDVRISHPFAMVQRVPAFWLFFYALGIPTCTILLLTLLWQPNLHKAHTTLLGLALSITTTLFLTDLFKDAVGRPRPDLISRCQPDLTAPRNTLVTISVCTQPDIKMLQDGFRSFPSGHSSFSFSGLGFLAMFLASQTHALRPRTSMAFVLLPLAPLLCASLIAISRLQDYRHGPLDVLGGSALGLAVAYFHFRRYYPSLLDRECDEPFSGSGDLGSGRSSPGGAAGYDFARVRDEEEGFAGGELERFALGEEDERLSVGNGRGKGRG